MPNTNKRFTLGPEGHANVTLIGEGAAQRVLCACGQNFTWSELRAHYKAISDAAAKVAFDAELARRIVDRRVMADLATRGESWTAPGIDGDGNDEYGGDDEEAYDEGREAAYLIAQGACETDPEIEALVGHLSFAEAA